jgi:hypothetical protein
LKSGGLKGLKNIHSLKEFNTFLSEGISSLFVITNFLLDYKTAIDHSNINYDMKNNTRIDTVCLKCN